LSKDIAIEMLKYLDFNDGKFFEVGAQDGLFQSNTVILERTRNWSGILMEPSPAAYNACLKNRDQEKNIIVHGALVSADYGKPSIMGDFFGHPMNSIGGKRLNNSGNSVIEVPAYTMNEILEKYNVEKIDFLSLDIEGQELWVLKDLNFEKWAPIYALIEWNVGEDATAYSTKYFPSHLLPKLSQESNINLISCFSHKNIKSSMLGVFPKTGDKNIAFVLLVIFSSINDKSKFNVSNSISTNTGFKLF